MPLVDTPAMRALLQAIDLAGSRRELARRISEYEPCASQRVDNWVQRDHMVPVTMAPFVSAAVDGEVSVRDLCPDYPGWEVLAVLLGDGAIENV
jgi:DNA-binding transcriptional regulator YdaS (Cro superfamily)